MATAKPQVSILLLLVTFGSVGAVLFTPALPSIQTFFGITEGQAQLTVTTYLVGYALGQLPYGPLANHFGRKRAIYMGIVLSILGSILCGLSGPFKSFLLLVISRFFQALGACVGLKVSFTMVADSYSQTMATRVIARMVIAFAVMPGIATALGGWITQLFTWEGCFYFLALYGAIVLWIVTRLPETSKHTHSLTFSSIVTGYLDTLKNKRLLICALMMGCGSAMVYVFASKSPFIGISVIGLDPETFGGYNLIPSAGMLLGSVLASSLVGRFSLYNLLLLGIAGTLITTVAMLVSFSVAQLNVWMLFLPAFFIFASESIVYANVSSFGLSTAENKSNASAVLNFINMSLAVIAVLLAELIIPGSALLLPATLLAIFIFMFGLWLLLKRIK